MWPFYFNFVHAFIGYNKLELNSTMLQCDNLDDGSSVLRFYPDSLNCWTGIHILHVVCAVTTSVIFIAISFIICITFFETRFSTGNPEARINARAEIELLIFKVLLLCLPTFWAGESNYWKATLILFIGS